MTPFLLNLIREPSTGNPLKLTNPEYDLDGNIISGNLLTASGTAYPIINGIPRFLNDVPTKSVKSFGDEWNYFNFIDFKLNWLHHTVRNTFGTTDAFKDKLIVDAGGGSGSQAKWFCEYGAKHVILLDLSHSVDDVVKRNLTGLKNVDVIQCSIDSPPLASNSIDGIVYCHNVIQHTPSVEKTATALWQTVATGGELVFNCYPMNDSGLIRAFRFHVVYKNLRRILSVMPFWVILTYARVVAALRLIPGLGFMLEKFSFVTQGDVPTIPAEGFTHRLLRRYRLAVLNTFDGYGSHKFQHHKTDYEILRLALNLQPDSSKIYNLDEYFTRPQKIGCALRILR